MWIPTEHEKYGVGKFNLPSYSSKKINCFHSRSAVRACVNVRTGGGEVAVLGCWFPAQLETEWLCFYHEASALFQTTQWWELGFHLTATLQSIRLPASPPPLLPPPSSFSSWFAKCHIFDIFKSCSRFALFSHFHYEDVNWRAILTSLLLCVRSGSVCFSGGGGGESAASQPVAICLSVCALPSI